MPRNCFEIVACLTMDWPDMHRAALECVNALLALQHQDEVYAGVSGLVWIGRLEMHILAVEFPTRDDYLAELAARKQQVLPW